MGANPTQATGVAVFLIAFALLAGSLASGGILYFVGFCVFLGISIMLFRKCKPWEHERPQ